MRVSQKNFFEENTKRFLNLLSLHAEIAKKLHV